MVQCAFFSREHQAIVVSMGDSLFQSCQTHVWEQARSAIVSKDHPLYASTRHLMPPTNNVSGTEGEGAPGVTHTGPAPAPAEM